MSKTPNDPAPRKRTLTKAERRTSRRCKMKQLMRIRPSDPAREPFEDLRGTQSVSKNGVYFQTSEPGYELGMRVFVTLPYFHNSSTNREYLAEVVRKAPLANGMTGIGLKLLLELGPQHSYSFDAALPPK